MKLRHPFLIRSASWLSTQVLRAWKRTLRFQIRELGANLDPNGSPSRQYIYAFWHESMLIPAFRFAQPTIHVLISRHADGQLITEIIQRLGFNVVRGSTRPTRREGAIAVRELLRVSTWSHLAVTPDGPRGPRRVAQPGLVYLAAKSGLPIVPCGFASQRPWRAKSWDRFAVPRPFARAVGVLGEPIVVPPQAVQPPLAEEYQGYVQSQMDRVTDLAERWAESGKFSYPEQCSPSAAAPQADTDPCPLGSSDSSPNVDPATWPPGSSRWESRAG